MPVDAVARRHGVDWAAVNALVAVWAGWVGGHRRRQRCRVLLVDETSIRKRHSYVTMFPKGTSLDIGQLRLSVIEDKLNHMPRRLHHWASAHDIYTRLRRNHR